MKDMNSDADCNAPPKIIFEDTFVAGADFFKNFDSKKPLDSNTCPLSHFQCLHNGYCLPIYRLCNGVFDCPGREDEVHCESYSCTGFYRCRGSRICLHEEDICDGLPHCPQYDDERFCNLTCHPHCTCLGWSFACSQAFPVDIYPHIRYLDVQSTEMTLRHLIYNVMLIYINMANCGVRDVDNITLPNLKHLDLSDNLLQEIQYKQLKMLPALRTMVLAGNPLVSVFPPDVNGIHNGHNLLHLDLSRVKMKYLNLQTLSYFQDLQVLNLTSCGLNSIVRKDEQTVSSLNVLAVQGCLVTYFPKDLFLGMTKLTSVYTDNFKLCCPSVLPTGFNLDDCHAPFDELSSCQSLLRSNLYRVFLATLASFSLLGNLLTFVVRLLTNQRDQKSGFGRFVLHLCVADFFMGLYLLIIGVADQLYMGNYLWEEMQWRHSTMCKVAGFMSMMACEVSAFIICFITLDRFLVLRFPFSRLRFRGQSANLACAMTWMMGFILAVIPLLPLTSHWEFYSQTGICIPLPVTRKEFSGHYYAFGVMIIVNFFLFLLIAIGQGIIYSSIQSNQMEMMKAANASRDITIARRLLTVVLSDFFCWFPIGLLGLLASQGTPIPGDVNVGMAVFVIPLNSVLNPFLYTLNSLLEKRRKIREQKLMENITQRNITNVV